MTNKEIQEFRREFLKQTGKELSIKSPSGDDDSNKVERFIRRVVSIVEAEIWRYNAHFRPDKLDDFQKEMLLKAQIEQGLYMFSTGDLDLMSGLDPISGNFIPVEELRKRAFSPLARQYLMRAGLLYRGVGGHVRADRHF